MSCYTRKMAHLMRAAGRPESMHERRKLDRVIRGELGMETEECSKVWEKVSDNLSSTDWVQSVMQSLETE